MARLAKAPGAAVYNVADVLEDRHFGDRQNIVSVDDDELGELRMQNVIGKLSATPCDISHAGPALGKDNQAILIDELVFSEQELQEAGIAI